MISNQTHVPLVNCYQVFALVQLAQELPSEEQVQLFNDLERDPDVGPVVVSEVRSHLQYRPS